MSLSQQTAAEELVGLVQQRDKYLIWRRQLTELKGDNYGIALNSYWQQRGTVAELKLDDPIVTKAVIAVFNKEIHRINQKIRRRTNIINKTQ